MTEVPDSPWRSRDFRVLFAAGALSHLGGNVGYVAIPLLAVTTLDAGPGQAGALAALSTVAFLVIGLPAGAWLDRLPGRRVLVAADAARAMLFASIPVAWWLGTLSLPQLYAVVLLNGCATVFFDVGSQSVLPELVGRERLVRANTAVVSLMAGANIAGRGAGGFLVQLLTAPWRLSAGPSPTLSPPSASPASSDDALPRRRGREEWRGPVGDGCRPRSRRGCATSSAAGSCSRWPSPRRSPTSAHR